MAERRGQRLQLVALIDAGFSATEAGRRLGIPRTTAQGWARRYRNFGEVGRRPGSGRPRVSTREQDEALGRAVMEDSFRSARDLKAASGFPGCLRTVNNRLRTDYNIRHYRAAPKISMSEGQAVDRLASVTGCFDGVDWGRVIFSDETTISTDYYGRPGVYREPGSRFNRKHIHQRRRSGRISVPVWGWCSRDGAGVIERIYGRLNTAKYLHILENVFLPSARVRYPEGTLLFQQDNCSVHTAAVVQDWFSRKPEIEVINWPPATPDLNIIENVWAELKRRRREKYANQPPRNQDQLWDQVVETWEELACDQQHWFATLVDSMPRRIRAVVEADGWWTKY